MKNDNGLSFGVELESEVHGPNTLSSTRGRITFTERSIYLGTGKSRKVLYDGKSLDFSMKFKGKVNILPNEASIGDVYLNTADNGTYIKSSNGDWVLLTAGSSPAILDAYLTKDTNETVNSVKTFNKQIIMNVEPTNDKHLVRLLDLNDKFSSLTSVMRFKGKLTNISDLDGIVSQKVGDCYFIEENSSLYIYTDKNQWLNLDNGVVDLQNYYTKGEVDGLIAAIQLPNSLPTSVNMISVIYTDDRANLDIRKRGYKFQLQTGLYPLKLIDGSGVEMCIQSYYDGVNWNIVSDQNAINHTLVCAKIIKI